MSNNNVSDISTKVLNKIIDPIINQNKNDLRPVLIVTPKLNVIIRKNETKKDLASFLHGSMYSVAPTTWIKVIRNNQFTTWPGLTPELITKHLILSLVTAQGFLNQERRHLQSTKTSKLNNITETETMDDFFRHQKHQMLKVIKYFTQLWILLQKHTQI